MDSNDSPPPSEPPFDEDAWFRQLARNIGEVAKKKRLTRSMSRAETAARIGVTTEFYARLERGQALPSVITLTRMALALDLMVDDLLGYLHERREKLPWLEVRDQLAGASPEVRRLATEVLRAPASTRRLISLLLRELSPP